MNELEKAAQGRLYDANFNADLLEKRRAVKRVLHKFNHLSPEEADQRSKLLRGLFGKIGEGFVFEGQFYCDYGFNIEIGDNFYANVNLVILDGAKVTIGSHVFIAPNVSIYTAGHPIDVERRNAGLEYALPITIGDNVWIGGGVSILPGVTIGDGTIIGAGAVVNRDVPPNSIAAGNPVRVIRSVNEEDRRREVFSISR